MAVCMLGCREPASCPVHEAGFLKSPVLVLKIPILKRIDALGPCWEAEEVGGYAAQEGSRIERHFPSGVIVATIWTAH